MSAAAPRSYPPGGGSHTNPKASPTGAVNGMIAGTTTSPRTGVNGTSPQSKSNPATSTSQNNPVSYLRKEEEASIVAAFQKWDLAKNGYIDERELEQVLASLGIEKRMVRQIFKDVDRNKDNKIDYQEFVGWLFNSTSKQSLRTLVFPSYKLRLIDQMEVKLIHDDYFDGWFTDHNSIKPYVRCRDLFANHIFFQSPEGLGLESRISIDNMTETPVFEILEDNFQAVCIDVCLARTLLGPKVLGTAHLTLNTVVSAMATGLGSVKGLVLEIKSEATSTARPHPVGKITMSLVETPEDDPIWAKHKVQYWKERGLPKLPSMLEVQKVLKALTIAPEPNLIHHVPELAQELLLQQVSAYDSWAPERAQTELDTIAEWLDRLHRTVQKSNEVNRRASPKIAETGEKVATQVLTASLKHNNHQLMRHAMKFANRRIQ